MNKGTIEKVSGSGHLVNLASCELDHPPAAQTRGPSIGQIYVMWVLDTRQNAEDDAPRSLDPYWEITDYTPEEIDAIREADRLDPDLAEHYKDLLGD